jgi:hypothetical protein
MVEKNEITELSNYILKWLNNKIHEDLQSLINLKNIDLSDPTIRALAYQLYENNGVLKREKIVEYLSKLDQEQRKILRKIGVKFGRYHIFLFKLFKPNAVSLRITLWKNYHQKYFDLKPPKFGLNFLESTKITNQNFMLLCGFEKFGNCFVRIDILERLFIIIMNSNIENKNEIKLTSEMLNLLGCSKNNFLKLIEKMSYKTFVRDKEIYFKYIKSKNIKKNYDFN